MIFQKKHLFNALTRMIVIVLLCGGMTAHAAGNQPIKVTVDGQAVSFDVSPYVDDQNRTMVPLRFIGDKLGYQCLWQPAAREVLVAGIGKEIRLLIGQKKAEIDGRTVAMDTVAVVVKGRTMVPLRFILENMGADVAFNRTAHTVMISRAQVVPTVSIDPDLTEAVTGQVAVVSAAQINVRSGPDITFPVVKKAARGDVLLILAQNKDWFQVSIGDGQLGWVANWVVVSRGVTEIASRGEEAGGDRPAVPVDSPDPSSPVVENPADSADQVDPTDPADNADPSDPAENGDLLTPADPSEPVNGDLPPIPQDTIGIKGKLIVIDPGHASLQSGASDPGAIGPHRIYERDVVLAIANRLKKQLEAVGAFVLMTRAGDTNLTLAGRAALANRNNADAFISIHANANYSASISGTSTYYYGGSGQPAVRKKLAGLVQTEMVKSLGRINRGVLTANFAVLRETTVPSILVETAFISNPTEEALLTSADFQERSAAGIINGLTRFFLE